MRERLLRFSVAFSRRGFKDDALLAFFPHSRKLPARSLSRQPKPVRGFTYTRLYITLAASSSDFPASEIGPSRLAPLTREISGSVT